MKRIFLFFISLFFASILLGLSLEGIILVPSVILLGLIDGINPCAIGVMMFLLGYLVVFSEKPQKILKIGVTYIVTVYLVYFLVGIFLYQIIGLLNSISYHQIFHFILALALVFFGILNIKDFIFPGSRFSLKIPLKTHGIITKFVEKVSIPATVILAVLVTLCEVPCSLPLYVAAMDILSLSFLEKIKVLFNLSIYNLMFVSPLIIILVLVYSGELQF